MQETYISPSAEVIELLMEQHILTGSDPDSPYWEPGEDF